MKKVLFSLLCSAAFAMATSVPVSIVNTGSPAIADGFGNPVGPYTLTVNGQTMAAMSLDNFYTVSGNWSAVLTSVNSADLSNTYLRNQTYVVGGTSLSSSQVYKVEAYLDSEINRPGADRIDLQDAAWTLMNEVTGNSNRDRAHTDNSVVTADIHDALDNYSSFNASAYEIVSQVSPGSDPEQEFVIATPEPASLGLFGGALLALGVLGIRSRRSAITSARR